MNYAFDQYFKDFYPILWEFVDDHHMREEKEVSLIHNLFCWRMIYSSSSHSELCWIEDYITDNVWLRQKPILISWLREWKKAIPKFYYVGYKYNDRVLVVVDMLEEKTLDVMIYDPLAVPPKKGEIVMGTLLPLGDELYFPLIDFYHFDFEAREEIARHFRYYYDQYSNTSDLHETFIHVLSAMLQIERLATGNKR